MSKTLILSGYAPGGAITVNTTQYWYLGGSPTAPSTVEANFQTIWRSAGTFSKLSVNVVTSTTAAAITVILRKNGANVNSSASLTAGTTGLFEDPSSTDAVSAGEKWCVATVGATTGTMAISIFSALFDATTNTVQRLIAGVSSFSTASSTTFFTPAAEGLNATEANAKHRVREAGTFKNAAINVITARGTTTTIKSRKNGADGNIAMSLTASTTGWFEDLTHSDTVAIADDWNWAQVNGTGTVVPLYNSVAIDFESTGGNGLVINGNCNGVALNDATTNYVTVNGRLVANTGESKAQAKAYEAFVCSELQCFVTQNDITSASTVDLRVNTASSALTISVTGSTTGYFADSTHSVTLATTDLINYRIVAPSIGGAHTLTLTWIGMYTNLAASLTRVSLSQIYINKISARVSLVRIYKNKIVGRISLSRIYKNKILTRISLSRIYKNKIRARISLSRIYKNKIVGRISLSRIYKNKIGQRVSLSRIYKNKILTRVSLTRIYKNRILTRVSLSRIYKNKIVGRISLSRVYKNRILVRVSLPRIYKNKIVERISLTRIYKNKIQARVSLSRIYKNRILTRVSLPRIYKNKIFQRISLSHIYKNRILTRLSLSRIYKNKIVGRISLSRVYKNKIQARVSLIRIYKNQILVTGLTRISLSRIYVNKIQTRVSLSRTYKNKILQRVQEIFYNLAIPGNTSAALQTGGSVRYGILFGASSSFIGKPISSWTVGLFKTGTPSGNITAAVYDNANTVVATFNETIDSTTLPTSTTPYKFNLSTPRTIVANDRLVILYGGAAAVNISIYNTDQIDGSNTLRTRWNGTSWVNGTTEDVAGLITGLGPQQTYKNRILERVSLSRIYKNKLFQRISLSRVYKNRILARVSLSRIYKNRILTRVSLSRIYKNRILTRISLSRIYKNKILQRISLTRIYKNQIIAALVRVSLSRIYKNRILQRTSSSRIYKNRILTRLSLSRVYKNRILTRLSLSRIYKNRILTRVSLPRIYKNKILARVSLSRTYKNQIITFLQRISLTRIYKNRILVTPPTGAGGGTTRKKRNRFRAWIAGWAKDTRELFRIKTTPPPPEEVEIPEPQPKKIFHILPSPPTMETKLQTLNDKWSVVASTLAQPPEVRTEVIYPVIINPDLIPLTQTRVTFPPGAIKQTITPTYRVADGIHMHSDIVGTPKPKNRSKVASTINTLMILLEIERQV